jgi:hypothetical protein
VTDQYNIYTGKNKRSSFIVQVDAPSLLNIPPHIAFGVSNKAKKYKDYLEKCFDSDNELLELFVRIHNHAKRTGSVQFQCRCCMDSFHAYVIADFLDENRLIFNDLVPYLIKGEISTLPVMVKTETKSIDQREDSLVGEQQIDTEYTYE